MLKDLYLFAGAVALGAVVIIGTVRTLERWKLGLDKPRIRRPLRVHKVRRTEATYKATIRPDDRA